MCTGSVEVTLKNPKTDLERKDINKRGTEGHKQKVRKNKKEKKS